MCKSVQEGSSQALQIHLILSMWQIFKSVPLFNSRTFVKMCQIMSRYNADKDSLYVQEIQREKSTSGAVVKYVKGKVPTLTLLR